MLPYKLIQTEEDLFNSLLEFNKEPIYFRELLGNAPMYFIHCVVKGKDLFGLSKFCGFDRITAEAYISGFRYYINGGLAQQRIKRTIKRDWIPYEAQKQEIKTSFQKWVHSFFPNYTLTNAKLLTVEGNLDLNRRKSKTSPDELKEILKLKEQIGYAGETIAYQYECDRLRNIGVIDPSLHVKHVSLENVNAGFDIFSDYNGQTRLIEVKSNTKSNGDIYFSDNELMCFNSNYGKAFLYLVTVTDVKKKIGFVVNEISNLDQYELKPTLYKLLKKS